MPGETVAVELRLSGVSRPVRTHAVVRYQDKLRCGLEFVPMTPEQRAAILQWARNVNADAQVKQNSTSLSPAGDKNAGLPIASITLKTEYSGSDGAGPPGRTRKRKLLAAFLVVFGVIAIAAGAFWWKWNRDWAQLEAGLDRPGNAVAEKPQLQVPAEVMQKLLVHRVEPVYPPDARKQNLQGVIALNIVIGRDGSVLSMRALNGPEILGKAAMEALRWWKFEPYRLNGTPAVVETTVAVEFKRQP